MKLKAIRRALAAGIAAASLLSMVAPLIFPPRIYYLVLGILKITKDWAVFSASAAIMLATIALYFLNNSSGKLDRVIRRYERNARKRTEVIEGSRIIALRKSPPSVHFEPAPPREQQVRDIADVFVSQGDADFGSAVEAKRQELASERKPNSEHLILWPRLVWPASAPNAWLDHKANQDLFSGTICDFSMLQTLRNKKFAAHTEEPLRRIARVSGNVLLCCTDRQALILHLRDEGRANHLQDYSRNLHLFGGNFDPATDLFSLRWTATRKTWHEAGLVIDTRSAPCLLVHETSTNWHMPVFLGVGVTAQQYDELLDDLDNDVKRYDRGSGVPKPVPIDKLVETMTAHDVVPSCYQSIVAWLLAGAPVDGKYGLMSGGKAERLAQALLASFHAKSQHQEPIP